MKHSWSCLPQELLQIIFKCPGITTKTILELNLVCKNWGIIAQEILYNSIILDKDNIAQFIYTLNDLDSPCANYVKTITITEGVDLNIPYDEDLILLCPNITELWIEDITDEYYQLLLDQYNEGNLQHYEQGTIPTTARHTNQLHVYNRSMVAMKKNITKLLLADTLFQIFDYNYATDDFEYLSEHLHEFSRLKYLKMESHAPKFLFENDALIQKCSSELSTLLIAAYNKNVLSKSTRPMLELECLQRRPNVKSLIMFSDVFTTKDMEYIMFKFPELKMLKFQCNRLERAFRWENLTDNGFYSTDVLVRFIEHMTHIKAFEVINFSIPPGAIKHALLPLAKCSEIKALRICSGPNDGAEHASLNLCNDKSSILYGLTERSIKSWETQLLFRVRNLKMPYENLLNIFSGENIESLTIKTESLFSNFIETAHGINHMHTLGSSLGRIFDCFPNLKEVYLKNVLIRDFSCTAKPKNLKTLSIESSGMWELVSLDISKHISSIDHLILCDIDMVDDSLERGDDRWLFFRFPDTTFDTIEVIDSLASGTGCIVRICIGSEETEPSQNFLLKKDTIRKITEDQSDYFLMETDMFRVEIVCAGLNRFGTYSVQMGSQPLFIILNE
ncbi:hypothetical protein INT46_004707 [Mucor plumbeus]|uniref:F-box domain-containing protein n=1 Tax=Mucor plumbeus TaxID=97098 RepID=A0A8H7RK43_9FUNG|nr:hypothetical protein INT46_004707 [Mucor plumbeus]